ncbi:MAG: prolipoprotein diacylglyceryl transferase [Vicinamibacteria bacterium]|nr:prolipoprotein diacylglyceryl transferase [Vicinamibacteria bacterium]
MPAFTRGHEQALHLGFEIAAYAVGFSAFLRGRGRIENDLPIAERLVVIAGAVLGAAAGSRAMHLLQVPSWTLGHLTDPSYVLRGKSIVGGLIGGHAGVELAKKAIGVSRSTGDLFVYPLLLAIGIGRVGCFLAGLTDGTYGSPTSLPWGVDFGDGMPRHPTQIYEILALTAIAMALRMARHRLIHEGSLFRAFMAAYLGFRLLVEFLKPWPGDYLGLSGIQVASLLGVVYYLRAMLKGGKTRARPHSGTR